MSRVYCGAQILCAAFTLLLAACSGGGGSDSGGGTLAISASTTNLTFTAIQNGPTPPAQQVVLTISGGTVFIGISSVTGSTFSTSFSITGLTTGAITVTPVAPTLPGTYTGTITARGCPTNPCASDVAGSPVVINVSYTIQPQTGFSASPQSFSLSQLQGGPAVAPQTLALSDLTGGSYAWNASIVYQTGSGWLNLNGAASGSSLPASLSLSVNSSSTLGTLNAIVRITGNGNSIDVPVSFTVSEPQLTVSPAQVTFSAFNQGPLPLSQLFTLITQGVPLNFTTSISYGAGPQGWLNPPPNSSAPGTFGASVNTTNLAPGTYTATLSINTATQTVPIGVTYVVATSSLTFSPSPASFTIDSTSVATALSKSVIVGSTGGSLSWTAASNQPWVTVSPANGSSGATVTLSLVPAEIDALDPGTSSATLTFSYTPLGGSLTNTPLAVSLNLLLPKVASVTPYVATSGTSKEVILRGLGFFSAAGAAVKFGSGATVSSYTVASGTEIRVTHPSLTAGPALRVSIANQLSNPNIVRSTADLVVVDAPVYAAETIAYPDAAAKKPLRIIYDAERQALLVGVGLPIAGANGSIYRYTFSGSAWSLTPAPAAVSTFRDLALSQDGKNLIAATDLAIKQFDSVTLAAGISTDGSFILPQIFFKGIAVANDGNAVASTGINGSGFTDTYRYSVRDGVLTRISNGSLYDAASGASADGSRVVLVQGGLSPAGSVFQYSASTSTLSQTALASSANFPNPVLDRTASRILIGGNLVYDANFQLLGSIPFEFTVALSPDGSRAYAYSTGTVLLHAYDLVAPPVAGVFQEIGTGTALPSDPGLSAVMTVSPDGGTLFIAGADAIVVVPAPPP